MRAARDDESRAFWSAVRSCVLDQNPDFAGKFDISVRGSGCAFRFDFGVGQNLVIFGGKTPQTRRQIQCLFSSRYALDWVHEVLGKCYEMNLLLHSEDESFDQGPMDMDAEMAASVCVFNDVHAAAAFLLSLPEDEDDY